ncbi:MAG: hypothetical protein HFJ17_06125 [Clostridia bacterium]|nr:hypothetical protein [Clostridia bacterium]
MTRRNLLTVVITGLLIFNMCGCSNSESNQEREYPISTLTVTNKYADKELDTATYLILGIPSSSEHYYIEFELDNGYKDIEEMTNKEEFLTYDIGDTVQVTVNSKNYSNGIYYLSSVEDNLYPDFNFYVNNPKDYEWTYISEAEWQQLRN